MTSKLTLGSERTTQHPNGVLQNCAPGSHAIPLSNVTPTNAMSETIQNMYNFKSTHFQKFNSRNLYYFIFKNKVQKCQPRTTSQATILKPLYVFAGIDQLSKWMVNCGSQLSHCGTERSQKAREEVRMIHVVMGQNWKHQYKLIFSLTHIQMIHMEILINICKERKDQKLK